MHFQGSVIGRNISKTVFCHTSVQCTVCSSHILDSELLSFVRQFILELLLVSKENPFMIHDIVGTGFPVALQNKIIFSPSVL